MSYLLVRQYAAASVFYILSVLLFPVTLLGYVIWVGKGILTWSASGVSGTAQGPLYARWFEHNLGTRQDEPANRLMMVLPGIPRWGLRLVSAPTLLAHRLTGYVPRAFRYPLKAMCPRSTRPPPAWRSSTTPPVAPSPTSRSSSSSGQASTHAPSDCPRMRG